MTYFSKQVSVKCSISTTAHTKYGKYLINSPFCKLFARYLFVDVYKKLFVND